MFAPCLLVPVLDLLIRVRQREPPACWGNTAEEPYVLRSRRHRNLVPKQDKSSVIGHSHLTSQNVLKSHLFSLIFL